MQADNSVQLTCNSFVTTACPCELLRRKNNFKHTRTVRCHISNCQSGIIVDERLRSSHHPPTDSQSECGSLGTSPNLPLDGHAWAMGAAKDRVIYTLLTVYYV